MEATRSIEIFVSGMDYGCCGVPFALGDDIGFSLFRVPEPSAIPGAPEFADERHNASGLPLVDVRGRVERIVAIHSRVVAVPGAHYRTSDPHDTIELDVDAAPVDDRPEGYTGADYRVRLRIAASSPLPARPPAAVLPVDRDTPRPGPSSLLTAVVARVEARFGDEVEILRGPDDTAVTLAPRRPGALSVRWNARDGVVVVELERAVWRLPWDAAGAATLVGLVEAAAAGRFRERLDDGRFLSVATLADGRTLSTSAEAPSRPEPGVGVMAVSVHERLQRALRGEPYQPWTGSAQ